jgi:hypothetical protein
MNIVPNASFPMGAQIKPELTHLFLSQTAVCCKVFAVAGGGGGKKNRTTKFRLA